MPTRKRGSSSKKSKRSPKRRTTELAPSRARPFARERLDVNQWPVVHAFVPRREPWRVSGCGSAGIARRRPDGRLCAAVFWLELMQGGIVNTWGYDAIDEDEFQNLMADVAHVSPPSEPMTEPNLLAQYAWGAYAISLSLGYEWTPREMEQCLRLLPPPPWSPKSAIGRFIAPDGLVAPGLWDLILTLQDSVEDVPQKMEIAIFTFAEFVLTGRERVIKVMRALRPEFIDVGPGEDGSALFNYTRKYPRHNWSPLKLFGGRQSIGTVAVAGDTLTAHARTLSMACRLVNRLKDLLGDSIRLRRTRWLEPVSQTEAEQWEPGYGPTVTQ